MSAFTVIPGSSLPTITVGDSDGFVFILTPLGGGNFRLDKISRNDFLTLGITEAINFKENPDNVAVMFEIEGVGRFFYDDTSGADFVKTDLKAIELQDAIGFMLASLDENGIGLAGNIPALDVYIRGQRVTNNVEFYLPESANNSDANIIAADNLGQSIVPTLGSSAAFLARSAHSFVTLNPSAGISGNTFNLPDANEIYNGWKITVGNISANPITSITWSTPNATPHSFPSSISANTCVEFVYFSGHWFVV